MTRLRFSRSAGIPLRYANRHGLITGPTGSGKTVTLMRLAEQFHQAGVPVFAPDAKGDLAALTRSCTTTLYDLAAERGRPIRTTPSAMGADLLARALELSEAQAGCLDIAFAVAEHHGHEVRSLEEFQTLLEYVQARREDVSQAFGHVSTASLAVAQRSLLRLERQGGRSFLAPPPFDVAALLRPSLSILIADRLIQAPRLYSTFLLWLLSELYDRLPEVGDLDRPRLVFVFDEAHLLFEETRPALLRRIERTVRLIRSKGVGIWFVTQRPDDVPAAIRDQLAHRIEHDRTLPIGCARLHTMTDRGMPAAPVAITIDKPSCELGALTLAEQSAHRPAPEPLPVKFARFTTVAVSLAGVIVAATGYSVDLLPLMALGLIVAAVAVS